MTIKDVLDKFKMKERGFDTKNNDLIFEAWELIKNINLVDVKRRFKFVVYFQIIKMNIDTLLGYDQAGALLIQLAFGTEIFLLQFAGLLLFLHDGILACLFLLL